MSRRSKPARRIPAADPVYNSEGELLSWASTDFNVLFWNTTPETVMTSSYDGAIYATGYLKESYFNNKRSIDFVAEPVFDGTEVM